LRTLDDAELAEAARRVVYTTWSAVVEMDLCMETLIDHADQLANTVSLSQF
jgi:hypothetical protein